MARNAWVDIVRKLIVGSRGRGRADRLVCIDAANVETPITVKARQNATKLAALVQGASPVRVEAYVGDTLADAWGTKPAAATPANDDGSPFVDDAPLEVAERPPKARSRAMRDAAFFASLLKDFSTSHARQLADAYRSNSERDKQVWDSLVLIAQHHSDRASREEIARQNAERSTRIRDRALIDQTKQLLAMQAKIAELAAEAGGDPSSNAFLELLSLAKKAETVKHAAGANGANGVNGGGTKPKKGSAAS